GEIRPPTTLLSLGEESPGRLMDAPAAMARARRRFSAELAAAGDEVLAASLSARAIEPRSYVLRLPLLGSYQWRVTDEPQPVWRFYVGRLATDVQLVAEVNARTGAVVLQPAPGA